MRLIGNYISCIDSSLQCYNEYEDFEEAVVEQIVVKQ